MRHVVGVAAIVRRCLVVILAVAAASPSYDDVLERYNACANRSDAPGGYHVWNGAHGHYEIGNIFIGWVHAFIDALLENKRLVVSPKGRDYFAARGEHAPGDVGTQARLMALFATRVPFAPAACAARGACTESGWNPLHAAPTAAQATCVRRATRCAEANPHAPRPIWGVTCCRNELFQCVSHVALNALVDLDATARASPLADAARAFRPLYSAPDQLDRLLLPPRATRARGSAFAVAIHLRLILPGVDHSAARNTDLCELTVARKWTRGRCRDETWRAALAHVRAVLAEAPAPLSPGAGAVSDAVFVNSESNVVTDDLIRYLRNHSINAQGFVYAGSSLAADGDTLSGAPIDFVEWWFLARAARIYFAGEVTMGARTSSFSLRAADMAGVPLEPIQKQCKGLSPGQYGPPFLRALNSCRERVQGQNTSRDEQTAAQDSQEPPRLTQVPKSG